MNEKLISILTIARKAGKAVLGYDPAVSAKTELILVTADISERSRRNIIKAKPDNEIMEISFTKQQLAAYFRKPTAVIGICDKGFADKIREIYRFGQS